MSRKPSLKKMSDVLNNTIGVVAIEDGLYEVDGQTLTIEEAYALVTSGGEQTEQPKKREAVRTPHAVEETALGIAQYMSSEYKVMARWGEAEVNLKNLIAAVKSAYAADTYITVTDSMVKNTVNKWKRNGLVEITKKGYFRSSETSRFDWTQFKR
jgi:hypothetical protein